MHKRVAIVVIALAFLVAPVAARAQWDVLLEGFGGWQGLQPNWGSLKNAANGNEGTALLGGDVLAELGGFGLGASLDKTVSGNYGQPWAGSLLAGFIVPLTIFRFEVLGEGGRRATTFGDMFGSNGAWFVGVRPGVRVRLGSSPFNIGAAALIRWPTSGGSFGSPDWGIVGRIGIEFP